MDVDYMNLSELADAEVALRMRKLNYEKFKTLVRMHLSFELDLNTDEFDLPCHEIVYEDKGKIRKWNRLSKKHKHHAGTTTGCASTSKGTASADNSPLEGLHQQINPGFLMHLQELKDFLLLEKNLTQEGLFRKTGSVLRQNDLRQQIQHDKPLDLEGAGYSAHDCATVFKGYLADLPEPLLTDAHYPAHSQIAPLCVGAAHNTATATALAKPPNTERIKREQHLLSSMQLLLLLLPDENRQLLQHIIEILHAVVAHESLNKMSPENLATLFAPHLICPRNMPPEALHYVSKKMSSIVAYMVCRGVVIFEVPAKLSTDIRAFFHERKRKKTMSPEQTLDESISDISTVNTVYTFVDREKTAAAHTTNTTDTELAQLYAHIQSLPESSKKRRLIKQFNKQNGQGTPLQLVVMNRLKNSDASRGTKSIGDSIKKHIFHKGIMSRTPKRTTANATPTQMTVVTPNFSTTKNPKLRVLFQSPAPSVSASISVSTSTPTLSSASSSSQSQACSTNVCTAANTPFSTKTHYHNHPLQKSISSSSLLNTPSSTSCAQHSTALHIGETECSSSSSSVDLNTGATAIETATAEEFRYSVSAPVSRQVSSDVHQQSLSLPYLSSRASNSSSCSSTSSASQHFQLLDPNCCVTPLKLISEAAKHLLSSGAGSTTTSITHGPSKTVGWEEQQLFETAKNSNSCPAQQESSKELKSRYKSEPDLCRGLSKGFPTGMITTTALENEGHTKTNENGDAGSSCSLTRKLMKGVSMSNLKFPFSTPESTKRLVRSVSSTLRRRSNEEQLPTRTPSDATNEVIGGGVMSLLELNDLEGDLEDLDDETFEDNPADNLDSDSASNDDRDSVDGEVRDTVPGNGSSAGVVIAGAGGSSFNDLASCSGESTYQQLLLQQSSVYRNLNLITSTPSLLLGRRSMSPITKSTQRMPKAMQESIMTPRSRKPVMVLTTTLSSSDQNQTICQTDLLSFREQDEDEGRHDPEDGDDVSHEDEFRRYNPQQEKLLPPNVHDEDAISVESYINILEHRQEPARAGYSFVEQHGVGIAATPTTVDTDVNVDTATNSAAAGDTLSNNFKEYLLRRSVLTASPVDSSFSSQPDDFCSTQDIESLDDSQLSPRLLYCLDGNQPEKHEANSRIPSEYDTHNTKAIDPQVAPALLEVDSNKDAGLPISSGSSRQQRNRIANNPFILLNNARKRAATSDLEKVRQLPTSAATAVATNSAMQSTEPANKENFEHVDEYLRSRKLLISEYPGETSF